MRTWQAQYLELLFLNLLIMSCAVKAKFNSGFTTDPDKGKGFQSSVGKKEEEGLGILNSVN